MFKKILPFIVSAGILLFLYRRLDLAILTVPENGIDIIWLAAAFLTSFLFYNIIVPLKVGLITEYSGYKAGFRRLFRYQAVSYALKFVFPFKTGEIAKIFAFSKITELPLTISFSILLFDKISGIFPLFLFLLSGLAVFGADIRRQGYTVIPYLSGREGLIIVFISFIASLFFVLYVLRRLRPLISGLAGRERTDNLYITSDAITMRRKIAVFAAGLVFQTVDYIIAWFIFRALKINAPGLFFIAAMTLVIIFSTLPITAGGLGIRESLFVFFFGSFAGRPELLYAGLLLSFAGHIFPALFGVLPAARLIPLINLKEIKDKIKGAVPI